MERTNLDPLFAIRNLISRKYTEVRGELDGRPVASLQRDANEDVRQIAEIASRQFD
jgi:hypothetical protein